MATSAPAGPSLAATGLWLVFLLVSGPLVSAQPGSSARPKPDVTSSALAGAGSSGGGGGFSGGDGIGAAGDGSSSGAGEAGTIGGGGGTGGSSSSSGTGPGGQQAIVCDAGCPQETFPVCGDDGEWYQNRCIAFCSGVRAAPDTSTCADSPMPFEDFKPGPQGAESNGLGLRMVAQDVINAFRDEGLRYVGRIRLARELTPQPAPGPLRQPEPPTDDDGHWAVDAVRCTSDGDVYRGTMKIPKESLFLEAGEPLPLAPWIQKAQNAFGGSDGEQQQQQQHQQQRQETVVQESGSYADADAGPLPQRPAPWRGSLSNVISTIRGMFGSAFARNGSGGDADAAAAPGQAVAAAPATGGPSELTGDNYVLESAAASYEAGLAMRQQAAAGGPTAPQREEHLATAAGGATTAVFERDAAGETQSAPAASDDEVERDLELARQFLAASAAAGAADNGTDAASASALQQQQQQRDPRHRRLLEIIGSDNRFICDRGYPYTALGQIQVVDNTGLYICTGTLIKPDKVLTAAHCVWNTKRNAFYFNLNFSPGRYRAGGSMVNPWGVVPWKSVTVFDAFKKNPATWDVAIVTLSKKLGSLTGYMGMAAGCSSNTGLTVAGYPQDQAQGTCMANTCKVDYIDCNALTNTHTCDTLMGMSGSPLWDAKNRIRMIHVAGIADRDENRATTVTQFLLNTISKW